MPKVTVILTSLNHANYIRETIDSVLNQTFTDFELIIWDDASSDGSWDVINSYSDWRIKAFRNEVTKRAIHGINTAILEVASGEYIAIHHSDDVWEVDKLDKQVTFLDTHPKTGAIFTNASAIGEDGSLLADEKHFYSNIFDQPNRSRHEWLRYFFSRGNALCHPSVLIRRTCYADCGLYRYGLAQLTDFDMWIRLCLKYEIHVLQERLVKFRVRNNEANASGSRPEVRIRDRSEFCYILKHFFRIATFEELVSIFPEAEKYYRANGCVPKFVMAMVALGENSLPWAKFLGIETLLDLITDTSTREKIQSLYQFDYRDLVALTGKYDLFSLETVAGQSQALASQSRALTECEAVINNQAERIAQLTRSAQSVSTENSNQASLQYSQPRKSERSADRVAYENAAHLFESGQGKEGIAQLEALAEKGSSCWDVYNDLAVQYFNDGDNLRAAPYFKKGIKLEGKSGITARNFATMLLMTGDMEGALAVLGGMLHEQPHDAAALTAISDILSSINPLPADAWLKLVSDLRGEQCSANAKPSHKTNCQSANEVKIFQIYYDAVTKSKVDPNFIPLDNSENLRPDWCEYWPIRNVLLNHSFDEDAYLGFFSPRFFEKTGMDGNAVLEKTRFSNEEVISFSPYFDQGAIHANPFIQGEVNHPGIIETTQNLLTLLNVDLKLDSLVCDQTTTIFSNYFVARYSFWKKWFAYAEKIFDVCEGPDCNLKNNLVKITRHRKGADYAMKVFVLERLVTIVMEELGVSSRVAIDIRQAPLLLPGSRENLVGLLIGDALKGQYRKTGLSVYKDAFFTVTGAPAR